MPTSAAASIPRQMADETPQDAAERIKRAMRGADTRMALIALCDDLRPAVTALASTPEGKPLAIQCANLKHYMLERLK